MRTKLILAGIFSIFFSGCVIANGYPSVIPFKLDENNLNQWINDREKAFVLEKQEIILLDGLKLIAILQSVGSGIVKTNAYVYTCEKSNCSLLTFNVLDSSNVRVFIDYKTSEIHIKSKDGVVLSRSTHRWIEWLRNMKGKH